MDPTAIFAALPRADQLRILSRHFATEARREPLPAPAPAASGSARPLLYRTYALGGGGGGGAAALAAAEAEAEDDRASTGTLDAEEEIFVPEEVPEAAAAAAGAGEEEIFVPEEVPEAVAAPAAAAEPNALLVALGLVPPAAAAEDFAMAEPERAVEPERAPVAPPAEDYRAYKNITPSMRLAVAENTAELVEQVRNGEIVAPLWGSAATVKMWRAGKKHDPDCMLCVQIRQQIRNGNNTKRAIQEDLGVTMDEVSEQVREMSKMGIIRIVA